MSIRATNNVKFAEQPQLSGEQETQLNTMISDLEGALTDLASSKDYYEYLSMEDQAKIETMKSRVRGEIELLETVLKTGIWPTGGVGTGDGITDRLPDMEPGWNGDFQYMDHANPAYDEYSDAVAEDGGTLTEVITLPQSSNVDPNDPTTWPDVGLCITDKENVQKITGKTVGDDIWVTIEYKDGKPTETLVLKDCTTNNARVFVSAEQCTSDIIMDFSQVARSSNGLGGRAFGANDNGVILVGGKGNDIIIGSQSDDMIVGWEGDDKLYAMGGNDAIYGDGITQGESGTVSINDGTGGNDYIDGGTGGDSIFGGGGTLDQAVSGTSDNFFDTDAVQEVEDTIDSTAQIAVDDIDDFRLSNIECQGWETTQDPETGEIVIKRIANSEENAITISAPDGYTMVTIETDPKGRDAVATFVKMDEDENGDPQPKYIRVRIEGVSNENSNANITINGSEGGSIIDARKFLAFGNNVTINGNSGSDALFGPITNLDYFHIKASAIQDGTNLLSESALNQSKDGMLEPKADGTAPDKCIWGGDHWDNSKLPKVNDDGEIELTLNAGETGLDIIADPPKGIAEVDAVFYEKEGDDLIVYVVNVTNVADGEFEMVKYKIHNGANNINSLTIGVTKAKPMGSVTFNGGDGADLIFGNTGNTIDWGKDDDNTVVQGWTETTYEDTAPLPEEEKKEVDDPADTADPADPK